MSAWSEQAALLRSDYSDWLQNVYPYEKQLWQVATRGSGANQQLRGDLLRFVDSAAVNSRAEAEKTLESRRRRLGLDVSPEERAASKVALANTMQAERASAATDTRSFLDALEQNFMLSGSSSVSSQSRDLGIA